MINADFSDLAELNDEGFAAEAEKLRKELNAAIAKLNERRANLSRPGARFAQENRGRRVSGLMMESLALRDELASLLECEIEIRECLESKWFPRRHGERSRMRDQAEEARAATEAEVRRRLIEIGYTDAPVGSIGAPTPDMITRHPAVLKARGEANAAFDRLHQQPDRKENQQTLARTRDRLEGMLRKAMAV